MTQMRIEADSLVKAAVFYGQTRERWEHERQKLGFRWGERFVKHIKDRFRTGGTTEDRTAVRTGALRRSYAYKLETPRRDVTDIRVGVMKPGAEDKALEYAATHEFGATIKAKHSKFLAIPLDAAKTAAGVPRGGPREFENTFFIKRDFGGLIMQRQADGRVVPLFVLKPEVTV